MKSVAIFYYSLTGNTEAAVRAVADNLPAGCRVHPIRIVPADPRWQLKVPFVPMWSTFLATMAPTNRGDQIAITTEPADWPVTDGVVIGSSTWWNRPCLPIQALLRSERFRSYVRDKPVGLFAACRGFFRNNLAELARAVLAAGARVVARERFTYTGSLIGTFMTFFALLRFGTPQTRWAGVNLPPYGFTPETLAKAKGFAQRFIAGAASGAPEEAERALLIKVVRYVCVGLAIFDLILAIAFTFLSDTAVQAIAPPGYAEPQFFQRCVGLFLFQYVFIQYLGYRDPRRWATALTMTVAVRATFAILYLVQVALWGSPFTLLHGLFVASAVLDLATTVFLLVAMARLDIGLFQGDSAVPLDAPTSKLLRALLLTLAVAEFLIGLSWLLLPRFLCTMFAIPFVVDPFWVRATGVFLLNIALIQLLGARDPNKYRSAALTSGVFRSLWPILYWVTTAHGLGTGLFRLSIMFFSFFDLGACIAIFWLIRRMSAEAQAQAQAAPASLPAPARSAVGGGP
jgi:hypothetical protein